MFLTAAAEFIEARKEYNEKLNAFSAELKARINAHNTVVRNLARKFNSDLTPYREIITNCEIIVDPATFTGISYGYANFTETVASPKPSFYSNKPTTRQKSIPFELLRNDPIASAVYVRKQIREMQKNKRAAELKKAQDELKKARQAKTIAENNEKKIAAQVEATQASLGRAINRTNNTGKKKVN